MSGGDPSPDDVARERRVLETVSLSFGGQVLRFVPAERSLRFAVYHPHTAFLVPDDVAPDVEIACAFGDPAPSAGPPSFDAAGSWQLRRLAGGSEEVCFLGRVREADGREPLTRLTVDAAFRRATVVQRPVVEGERLFRVGYPLDEYVAARLLGRSGGLVLHATALADAGGAYVFAGHSGAGKSTMARLAEAAGARVLSDDRTILIAGAGGVRAFGTPWHGTYRRGENESAPLRAIYLLVQSPADRVVPVPPASALKELFVRLVQPTVAADEVAASLDALERVVSVVPVAELHFRPTSAAYELARAAGGP